MKKILFTDVLLLIGMSGFAQEYRVVTAIESTVPYGKECSRIIDNKDTIEYKPLTTIRDDGEVDKGKRISAKERNARTNKFEETSLRNLYGVYSLNYQNVAANDAIITSKLNDMAKEGWELSFVTSYVEKYDNNDVNENSRFITRYIFRKK